MSDILDQIEAEGDVEESVKYQILEQLWVPVFGDLPDADYIDCDHYFQRIQTILYLHRDRASNRKAVAKELAASAKALSAVADFLTKESADEQEDDDDDG